MTLDLEGRVVRIDGIGFSAIGRLQLLQRLQARARSAGVSVQFQRTVDSIDELRDADLIVGADGVNSLVRRTYAKEFGASVGYLTNKFVWYGTTKRFDTLTQSFPELRRWCVECAPLPLFAANEHVHCRD